MCEYCGEEIDEGFVWIIIGWGNGARVIVLHKATCQYAYTNVSEKNVDTNVCV